MSALLLALLLAGTPPLTCPPGHERRGAAPTDGYAQWCEGVDPYGNGWRDGPARTWYDDGAPWIEETWREGERDGPFLELHRNGKKAREGAFVHGRKAGRWRTWYESGELEEDSWFVGGVRQGEFASYFPNGRRRTLGRHCGGAQCGRWRTFSEDGREVGTVDYGEQTATP
ncbi:MAG TPA: hypothetical protein VML50_06515 [Anaeromyxobacter sp.]|nr:hypothetical protein [Anaeromyxobacter sp.]